jgi:hypothetical protein
MAYDLLAYTGEGPVFEVGDDRTPLLLTDIGVREFSSEAPVIEVSSAGWTAAYQVALTANGLEVTAQGARTRCRDDSQRVRPIGVAQPLRVPFVA